MVFPLGWKDSGFPYRTDGATIGNFPLEAIIGTRTDLRWNLLAAQWWRKYVS